MSFGERRDNAGVIVQINGDRGSLFLVRGAGDQRFLVSKLFDVTDSAAIEDTLHTETTQIKVQFGKGIAGTVALTKKPINIRDAYQVLRPRRMHGMRTVVTDNPVA